MWALFSINRLETFNTSRKVCHFPHSPVAHDLNSFWLTDNVDDDSFWCSLQRQEHHKSHLILLWWENYTFDQSYRFVWLSTNFTRHLSYRKTRLPTHQTWHFSAKLSMKLCFSLNVSSYLVKNLVWKQWNMFNTSRKFFRKIH